jgi:hypothetical protein
MPKSDIISLRKAARDAGVSHQTVANWCEKYQIGELKSGRWHISKSGIDRIVKLKRELKVLG